MKFILVLLAVSVWTEARVRNSEALYVKYHFTRTWTANTHTATAEVSPEFAQEKNLISVHIGKEK